MTGQDIFLNFHFSSRFWGLIGSFISIVSILCSFCMIE